jgi:hypothetical protein
MPEFQGIHALSPILHAAKKTMLHCNSSASRTTFADIFFEKETDMVALTYGVARVPTNQASERAQAGAPRKTLFTRFMEALMESRLQQAHREIARHAHLLPPVFDEHGNRFVKIDEMPAGGR